MRIYDTLRIALRNLFINKRRSFLTMLGIIIGITSVVLVMSVGGGAQSLILAQIEARGTDQIAILAGASDEKGPPAQALGIVVTTLTEDDGLALLNKNNVRHVKYVAGYVSGNDVLQWRNSERRVTYTGTNATYEKIEKITMKQGRFFTQAEEDTAHVVVLGSTIAEELFGNQNPVGQSVKLQRKHFTVIGVIKTQGAGTFENPDTAVLIPLPVAQKELLGIRYVSFLRLIVDDEAYVKETIDEIKQTLQERHNDDDFSVRNIADLLVMVKTITGVLTFFLVGVAAVALFVGGVGVMNIMLIAVKEKTREIGLRKAVGARNIDIRAQFIVETILITTVGGIIGVVLGIIISFLIAQIVQSFGYEYKFIVSLPSIVISLLITGAIGLFFGLLPAQKASRIRPIEALRYE